MRSLWTDFACTASMGHSGCCVRTFWLQTVPNQNWSDPQKALLIVCDLIRCNVQFAGGATWLLKHRPERSDLLGLVPEFNPAIDVPGLQCRN